jgi:SAM-dependent methyltransferase
VAAYRHRPPYPEETFDILLELIEDEPRVVLDAGTGTGAIARGLVGRVDRIDAVDPSPGMLAAGRRLPGGDHPRLRWIEGTAEEAPLTPPYALITVAASLHWMDWAVVLPRFRDTLGRRGVFAIVDQPLPAAPWNEALQPVITHYSTNRLYRPYDLIDELAQRGLFRESGRRKTAPLVFRQTVADYVESFHARNGLSRDRMEPAAAAAFDREATALVAPHAVDGMVTLGVVGQVVWGMPAPD